MKVEDADIHLDLSAKRDFLPLYRFSQNSQSRSKSP